MNIFNYFNIGRKAVALAAFLFTTSTFAQKTCMDVEKVTVNRSTFVNKDAREQFELRRHKRIIDIIEPTAQTMEMLQDLNISNGVGIEIKA